MKKLIVTGLLLAISQTVSARGIIYFDSRHTQEVVTSFREIAKLASPSPGSASSTQCGYIFPGDGSKFGCKGTGKAAADVAAACSGGGSLACTGSGSGRTCTCAFD